MESKQCTPSVIARLMGLDELPPQQAVQKQQRVLSEKYLQRVASIGVQEKRSWDERHSFRINIEEQQEMNDIFEVLETLKREKHHNLSVEKGKANSTLSETKLAFISHNFIDAEHLPVDKKLQTSKEFHHALEVIDSNKDLFLKHLQEPDLLFTPHLHYLQGGPTHLQSGNISVLKSSNASDCRNINLCWKSGRSTEHGNVELLTLLSDSHGEAGFEISHNSLTSQLELKDESCLPPTRIDVLKPKLGKAENAARYISSPRSYEGSHSGDRKGKDFLYLENGKLYDEVKGRNKLANDMDFVRQRSRNLRDFMRQTTRKMRCGLGSNLIDISRSGFRGGDTVAKHSEAKVPSSSFFDRKSSYQSSLSYLDGSYVVREAKKQLSERIKMTKSFQELGLASKGITLGEMLDMPDNETRPRNLEYKAGKHGPGNQIGSNDRDMDLGSRIGISSRKDQKDGCVENLPRSRILPSLTVRGPKTGTRLEALYSDWYLRPEEPVNWAQHKSEWQIKKDGSKSRNSRFRCKKSESFPFLDSENRHLVQETGVVLDELKNKLEQRNLSEPISTVSKSSTCSTLYSDPEYNQTIQEMWVIQDELRNKLEDRDLSKQKFVAPISSSSSVTSANMNADVVAGSESAAVGRSSQFLEEQQPEPTAGMLFPRDDGSSHVPDTSVRQETSIGFPEDGSVSSHCSGTDLESLVFLEAAYQPSPDSVLEPLFKDEISSSFGWLESVGADLHGLRMKLQLLKSESSGGYSEGPGMIISSDDDSVEGSVGYSEEHEDLMRLFRFEESRDFSYLVDVLTEAGFHGRNLDKGSSTWHCPEFPMNSSVFETLEKKYGEQTSWKRSERRLLFDRINSGLMEILQPCMGVPTWAKPVTIRLSFKYSREVEEELWMLLASQEKEASKKSLEKVLGTEFGSLELGDDIEVIGRELERMLIEELTAEVVSLESF